MEQNYLAPHPQAVEQYRALLRAHGNSIKALGWPDQERCRLRYNALTYMVPDSVHSAVLDYGCGLGHLQRFKKFGRYAGVDVVSEFIDLNNRGAWPDGTQFLHINDAGDLQHAVFEHVIACGTFSYRVYPAPQHELHVKQNLKALFDICTTALHVDFLAPDPDPEYRKPELYNMSIHTLINWMKEIGCRRWIIDRSYLPFEYCIHMFKDQEIQRPENTYTVPAP